MTNLNEKLDKIKVARNGRKIVSNCLDSSEKERESGNFMNASRFLETGATMMLRYEYYAL